jgi:pimeloyl-ACP methyl ester carboxylesterase
MKFLIKTLLLLFPFLIGFQGIRAQNYPKFCQAEIRDLSQWEKQKPEIKKQIQTYITGRFPAFSLPISSSKISERWENGVWVQHWRLGFGSKKKVYFELELLIPKDSIKPKPVLISQMNHRTWGILAAQRGMAACLYSGNDDNDSTHALAALYPDHDFSLLAKRAFLAMRAIDFLQTKPWADTNCLAIAGHSRNGKQSLIAAAFDRRIDAVVSSSAGTGGEIPGLFAHPFFNHESTEQITRKFPDWFHPLLRSFADCEWEMPVDQTLLMGLIAPRPLLIGTAIHEAQACNLGSWKACQILKTMYGWYGKTENQAIYYREGEHGTEAETIEKYLDFLLASFGKYPKVTFPFAGFEYLEKAKNKTTKPDEPLEMSLLGQKPASASNTRFLENQSAYPDYFRNGYMVNPARGNKSVRILDIGPYKELGEYGWGKIYFPISDSSQVKTILKFPLVVFLHSAVYNTGYRKETGPMIKALNDRGFAVLCYDQIGFGSRQEEAAAFYDRFPEWTLLGKMVHDAQIHVNQCIKLPFIDSTQIFVLGQGLGSLVGLLAFETSTKVKKMAFVDPLFSFLGPKENKIGNWLCSEAGLCFSNGLTREMVLSKLEKISNRVQIFQPHFLPASSILHGKNLKINWIKASEGYSKKVFEEMGEGFR